jgi:transcriptional regulator with XRE-family HTH domain
VKKKQLHEQLREARLQAGFKRVIDAARTMQISATTIYKAESGESTPHRNTLVALAQRYGLAPDTFLEEASDREPASGRVTIEIDLPSGLSPELRAVVLEAVRNLADSLTRILNKTSHGDSP